MKEKELVLNLLSSEQDYDLVLTALGENPRQGNFPYKKMRLNQLLNKAKTSKEKVTTLELLARNMKLEKYKNATLEAILNSFIEEDEQIPYIIQYFVIKGYYPDFLEQKYSMICDNINQGLYFLTGVDSFESLTSLEEYYLSGFSDNEKNYLSLSISQIRTWYEQNITDLNSCDEKLSGADLREFHKLYRIHRLDNNEIIILKNEELKLSDHDFEKFSRVCGELGVLLGFCSEGTMKDEIYERLLIDALSKYNEVKVLIEKFRYKHRENILSQKNVDTQRQLEALKAEIKEIKKDNKNLKDEIKSQNLQKTNIELNLKNMENELENFYKLQKGYEWGLSTDYSNLKITVVSTSDMLYAKYIFPDIQFIDLETSLKEVINCNYLIVQYYGISYKERQWIENKNKSKSCKVISTMSRDERELIMDLAVFLKGIEGVEE